MRGHTVTAEARSSTCDSQGSHKMLRSRQEGAKEHFGRARGDGDLIMTVHMLDVDEHYQRRGLGSHLLEAIEERAQSLGASFADLHTHTTMATAVPFYESKGYEVCSSMSDRDYHDSVNSGFVMEGDDDVFQWPTLRDGLIVEMLKKL
jgi:ribosomal protein S18 acetylase RimI-like enzyme